MGLTITGMHRSGTSLVASLVSDLGASMGDGPAMVPSHANPRGFFERQDLADLNDALLNRLGGAWWAPPRPTLNDWQSFDGAELEEIRSHVDLLRAPTGAWFVKDPRISVLLPIWDRMALATLPAVVCLRHPLAVADSLELRDALSLRRGLALWFEYTRVLLSEAAHRSSVVMEYDQVLAEPRDSAWTLRDFLGAVGVAPRGAWDPAEAVHRVEPALRHHVERRDVAAAVQPLLLDSLDLFHAGAKLHGRPVEGLLPTASPTWVDEALAELHELWAHRQPPVSQARAADPAPVGPLPVAPADPASAEPAPADPASAEPAPADPASAEPAPADPVSAEPAPAEPVPVDDAVWREEVERLRASGEELARRLDSQARESAALRDRLVEADALSRELEEAVERIRDLQRQVDEATMFASAASQLVGESRELWQSREREAQRLVGEAGDRAAAAERLLAAERARHDRLERALRERGARLEAEVSELRLTLDDLQHRESVLTELLDVAGDSMTELAAQRDAALDAQQAGVAEAARLAAEVRVLEFERDNLAAAVDGLGEEVVAMHGSRAYRVSRRLLGSRRRRSTTDERANDERANDERATDERTTDERGTP